MNFFPYWWLLPITEKTGVDAVRSYIFTELERRRLIEGLETREEDQGTWEPFMMMRRNTPQLIKD